MIKKVIGSKKGIALLWSLVLCGLLLIISGTMVSFMVKESRMSINIEDSTQAYAHARTGIDWAKMFLQGKRGVEANGTYSFSMDPLVAGDELSVEISGDLSAGTTIIRSTGDSLGVKRAIEYKVTNNSGTVINPNPTPPYGTPLPAANTDSFTLQFDMWSDGTGFPTQTANNDIPIIGLTSNATPAGMGSPTRISLGLTTSNASLGDNPSGIIISTISSANTVSRVPLTWNPTFTSFANINSDASSSVPYRYRVMLTYLNGTQVSAKLMVKSSGAGGEYVCVAYGVADVSGLEFGDLRYLLSHGVGITGGETISNDPVIAGSYIQLQKTAAGGHIYIDNINFKKN
jgi:hypothetical protein